MKKTVADPDIRKIPNYGGLSQEAVIFIVCEQLDESDEADVEPVFCLQTHDIFLPILNRLNNAAFLGSFPLSLFGGSTGVIKPSQCIRTRISDKRSAL